VTAVTASTPPADAIAPTKRPRLHRERGVLSLAAIGVVSLLWLSLDAPGLKLVMPRIARGKTEPPVIANLAVQRAANSLWPLALDLPPVAAAPKRRAHSKDRRGPSTGADAIVLRATPTAPAPTTKPALRTVLLPTSQRLRISPAAPAPAATSSSPPATPSPPVAPAPVPVELPPAASQVVTTAVSTGTAAVASSTSDVAAATQQVTSNLP